MERKLKEDLKKSVEEITPWAVNLRREFHSWPEVGNQEYCTTERIKRELDAMGISTKQPLNTGVIGLLGSDRDESIALRTDIDGLPIQERIRLPFSSERQGFMHACGHDVHTAVLLGTAKVLSEHKDKIKGSVKFIFQPAEETTGGAERMIDAGCLKDPKVQSIYGFHVKPEIVAGKIGLKRGRVHASSDMFTIRIQGVASHGAYPDCGVDALVSASQIVANLQVIVSRNISPLDSAVITVGSFHSGTGVNTIADRAILEGTIRSFDPMTREH
ncbi:MAG: M20 family metallopeptidase, partial [Eubacteriales bacterium]|nr:M20 family metallopeptidase [Eubacteriales bacterium]